jgi:YD repeat-containing protein
MLTLIFDSHESRTGLDTNDGIKEKVLIALTIAALAATAMASETINYSYDARGRLIQVKHSGAVNNNVSANYTYDKANNRTNLNVASPNSPPP